MRRTLLMIFITAGNQPYGQARQAIRLPCYIVSAKGLILPAFSLFTGLIRVMKLQPTLRIS